LLKNNIRNVYQAIPTTAAQVASAWAGNKVFEYPDLKNLLPYESQQSAHTNMGLFQTIKQEIAAMNNGQNGQYADMRYQQHNPQNNFVAHQPTQQVYRQPIQNNQNNPVGFQPRVQAPIVGHQALSQQHAFARQAEPEQPKVEVIITEADWKPTASFPYKTLLNEDVFGTTFKLSAYNSNEVEEVIYQKGIDEMDRSKHQLVFAINEQPKMRAAKLDAVTTSLVSLTKVIATTPSEERQQLDYTHYIFPNDVVVESLSDAIYSLRLKKLEMGGHDVFVARFIVENTFPGFDACWDILDSLSELSTFEDMAKLLKKEQDTCKGAAFRKDLTENSIASLNNRLEYTARVNKYFTNMVNDFFKVNMTMDAFTIDSFMDDVQEIPPALLQRYSSEFAIKYKNWEHTVKKVFALDVDTLDSTRPENEPESISNEFLVVDQVLPVSYNLIYLDRYVSELGLVPSREAKRIDKKFTQDIYKLIEAAFANQFGFGLLSMNTLIVTKDDCVLELFKGYLGNDVYLCREYKQL
jgi:hypothetical protein